MTEATLAIDVRGMTKRFGDRTVVNDIALQVRTGEIYGFLGPNGSGKTTFIRMLCGLLRADAGSGTCLGYDVITESEAIKRQVGYMTQRFSFWEDLSIAENLDFVARMYGVPEPAARPCSEAIEQLGLRRTRKSNSPGNFPAAGSSASRWPPASFTSPSCCCSTSRRRASIRRRAAISGSRFTSSPREGLTFLITTHYMDEAERCHRLAYIAYGNLLAHGTVAEVIEHVGLTTWSVSGPDLLRLAERTARPARRAAGRGLRHGAARQRRRCRRAGACHRAVPPRALRVAADPLRAGGRVHPPHGTAPPDNFAPPVA